MSRITVLPSQTALATLFRTWRSPQGGWLPPGIADDLAEAVKNIAPIIDVRDHDMAAPIPKSGPDWGTCDGCGEDIAPEFLEAATGVPPDYMPEDFRKRATTVLCELCRTEGDEQ